ncbi:50S ribosomal protein L15 [Candidatus Portiera aleyrodidarum]|uniref:Large ribosomal subunit protein uL15 n=1 Tax=Candidatus Portiera aleyrodidarum TV TaxID=1297582 RepID=A0A8D4BPJ9_9GAMM|nr:50S ribosomal protein L15 [Candidatus Portiera aleyrodidarum]AGI27110.1 ribosomal protein L15 [Candidatus Portiera aleyrodidarum TV]CEI59078.1 50S ribosomal protein L15 [Candidatus Portiera aleyrodidarum]
MKLNKLKNCFIKEKKRLGRGIGSGKGKTCGKGHKGQKARSGKKIKRGFEGGQLPLKRIIPKLGFVSKKSLVSEEVRICELAKIKSNIIDRRTLKTAKLIKKSTKVVKIIISGELKKPVIIRGIKVTKGVRKEIEKYGGNIES